MSEALATLRSFLHGRSGISLGAEKDYLVVSRLEPQLRDWGVADMDGLAAAVCRQPSGNLATQVMAALTTNETLFFRDARPFEAFRTLVLPEAANSGSLSVWSAACSTGQEVYSLAMLLAEEAAQLRGCRFSILGTDISEPALARARRGVYSGFEVQRGLSPARLARHCIARDGCWEVRPELRTRASFRMVNLLELPAGLGPFDVIFCRNVLIYFDLATKTRVLGALAARLRPGGWLVLGGAETTLGISTAFVAVPNTTGFYQRC